MLEAKASASLNVSWPLITAEPSLITLSTLGALIISPSYMM